MYFFKEGSKLDRQTLPAQMDTPEMRQALETAMSFSEETRRRFLYQDRFIAELVENTRKNESRQSKEDLQRAKEALENAYGELKDMQFQLQKAEFAKDAAINQRALDKEARAQAEDEIRALKAQLAALKGSSEQG